MSQEYMAFSMSTGCVRSVRYCGNIYSRNLYTTLLLYRDEYPERLWLSLCLLAVLGLCSIVIKCTAAIYTQRCYCTGKNVTKYMSFSMPTGCVRSVQYCGKMYSRHLYTTLLLYRDEYHKSIWLSLCLLAVLGLCSIVVICTVAIFSGMVNYF